MADFTVRSNYEPDASIDNVVFGANAPLLEVELNELQMMQSQKLKRFIGQFIGDGLSDINAISFSSQDSTFTLGACYAVVGGEVIKCTGATISTVDVANIYLKVWRDIANYNAILKEEGNQDSVTTVQNKMIDGRVGVETTRREIVKYQLVTSKPVEDTTSSYLKLATITNNVMTVTCGSANVSAMVNEIRQELDNGDYSTPISNTNTITEAGVTALDAVQANPTIQGTMANILLKDYPDTAVYSQKTYAIGDYCIQTVGSVTKLYSCAIAITIAEVWNIDHWVPVNKAGFVTNTTDAKVYKVGADSVLKKCSAADFSNVVYDGSASGSVQLDAGEYLAESFMACYGGSSAHIDFGGACTVEVLYSGLYNAPTPTSASTKLVKLTVPNGGGSVSISYGWSSDGLDDSTIKILNVKIFKL